MADATTRCLRDGLPRSSPGGVKRSWRLLEAQIRDRNQWGRPGAEARRRDFSAYEGEFEVSAMERSQL